MVSLNNLNDVQIIYLDELVHSAIALMDSYEIEDVICCANCSMEDVVKTLGVNSETCIELIKLYLAKIVEES